MRQQAVGGGQSASRLGPAVPSLPLPPLAGPSGRI